VEKVIDYQDKSIFDKRKVKKNANDYRLPINSSNPEPELYDFRKFLL